MTKGQPKYEIYFKLKGNKRWLRNSRYYWSKKSAIKNLSLLRSKHKNYNFKIKPFKGWRYYD